MTTFAVRCTCVKGIIPKNNPPWIVSPVAESFNNRFPIDHSLEDVINLCASLARTLSAIHARGYSHRDIKPENILWHDERWCLCDFGLASVPNETTLTDSHKKLGPYFYIAPEMMNQPHISEGKKADVYSLAKLLWKLASGQNFPIPGTHWVHVEAFRISSWTPDQRAFYLDRLLERATQHEPQERLSMAEFATELSEWLTPPQGSNLLRHAWNKSRVVDTQRYFHDEKGISHIEERAKADRIRLLEEFREVLAEIKKELEECGFMDVQLQSGGADFYREISGDSAAGGGDNPIWFFQSDVRVLCRNDRLGERRGKWNYTTLMAGVNFGFPDLNRDWSNPADVDSPVLAAAGYILLEKAGTIRLTYQNASSRYGW